MLRVLHQWYLLCIRWAFIDLNAGPFSWGPAVGGEGVRTEISLPNVEKTVGAVQGDDDFNLAKAYYYFYLFSIIGSFSRFLSSSSFLPIFPYIYIYIYILNKISGNQREKDLKMKDPFDFKPGIDKKINFFLMKIWGRRGERRGKGKMEEEKRGENWRWQTMAVMGTGWCDLGWGKKENHKILQRFSLKSFFKIKIYIFELPLKSNSIFCAHNLVRNYYYYISKKINPLIFFFKY